MDDKYGVKVENRYALFLDDDENENDENQLLEQVAAKGAKKAAATSAGKTDSKSPQKGAAKTASTPIATDVRVKSTTGTAASINAKKSPVAAAAAAGAVKSAVATGKDGGASRAKFGAARVENDQTNINVASQQQQPSNSGRQKFASGAPREANDQTNERPPHRDGQYNRPRGGGYGAPRVNFGERSGNNNEGDSSQSGGGERPSYRGGGERRGGYRGGGYRGFEGGGYRGGDRQDRPPRQPRFEGAAEGGEQTQPESGEAAHAAGQDQQGDSYGQRDGEGRSGGQGGYNSEYGGRNRGYGGPREYRGGNRGGYRGGGFRNDAGEYGGENYGRRQFDRHSGNEQTGIKPIEKKGGGGGHNWGKIVDTDSLEPISADQFGDENGEGNQEGERGQGRKPRTKEDEEKAEQKAEEKRKLDAERAEDEKKMTLSQYKELQKQDKGKDAPKYNLRKPGEGEDKTWLKTATVLNESRKTHVEQQEEETRKDRHAQEHNLAQDILGIRYEASPRVEQRGGFRGDRGDRRGGYRGDSGRGGYSRDGENQDVRRGGYGGEHHGGESGGGGYGGGRGYHGGHGGGRGRSFVPAAPSISDPKDFPALGLGTKPAAAAATAPAGKA